MKNKVGRPKLTADQIKNVTSIRFTTQEKLRCLELARAFDKDMSSLIRYAINYLYAARNKVL